MAESSHYTIRKKTCCLHNDDASKSRILKLCYTILQAAAIFYAPSPTEQMAKNTTTTTTTIW